jgi:hypothetical protein
VNISGTNISGGVNFRTLREPAIVSGGNVTIDGAYTIRTFTSNANLTIQNSPLDNVQYLLIAAGGGIESKPLQYLQGGGGAGGLLTGNVTLSSGTYTVTIGQGVSGSNGQNSTWNNLTAVGGGEGGVTGNGSPGGSGGGAGGGSNFLRYGGSGTSGQGFAGGNTALVTSTYMAGGGGGASAKGTNGQSGGATGGPGVQSNITGSNVYYAGGGGGDNGLVIGGGGLGSDTYGGGANATGSTAATGNPGVLIIRYLTEGTA